MPSRVVNRREQHKQRTRSVLEDIALQLFAERGYEHTTIDDIASAAGVSVRTFFRYFSSKQHVLFGDVGQHRVAALGTALAARPLDEDPLESVRQALDAIDVLAEAELAQVRLRARLLVQQQALVPIYLMTSYGLEQQICRFVAERSGEQPTDPYPLLVSSAAAAAWNTALYAWATGRTPELAALRRSAFQQLTMGLRRNAA